MLSTSLGPTITISTVIMESTNSIAITTHITRLSFEARHFENSLFSRKHMGYEAYGHSYEYGADGVEKAPD